MICCLPAQLVEESVVTFLKIPSCFAFLPVWASFSLTVHAPALDLVRATKTPQKQNTPPPNQQTNQQTSKETFSLPISPIFPMKFQLSADVEKMTLCNTPAIGTDKEQTRQF